MQAPREQREAVFSRDAADAGNPKGAAMHRARAEEALAALRELGAKGEREMAEKVQSPDSIEALLTEREECQARIVEIDAALRERMEGLKARLMEAGVLAGEPQKRRTPVMGLQADVTRVLRSIHHVTDALGIREQLRAEGRDVERPAVAKCLIRLSEEGLALRVARGQYRAIGEPA